MYFSVLYCMAAALLLATQSSLLCALVIRIVSREGKCRYRSGYCAWVTTTRSSCESEFKFVGSERGPRRVAAWRAAGTRPAAHVFARAFDGTALGQGIFGLNASLCRETAVPRDNVRLFALHSILPQHSARPPSPKVSSHR